MTDYRDQIAAVVRAVTFPEPGTYTWFGVRAPRLPAHIEGALTPATGRNYLLYRLQAQLYRDFYRTGGAVPGPRAAPGPLLTGTTPFVEQLAAANAGRGCLETGWQLLGRNGARAVATRGGPALWLDAAALETSASLTVRLPKDLPAISPGYYMALGDRALPPAGAAPLVRFYWHVDAAGAVRLMALLTARLNGAGLPFRLKVVSDPRGFGPCDAAVLYTRQVDYAAVAEILCDIYPALAAHLGATVPALTHRLAPGLGLAEDPGQGESFGLHRCLLLAEGLVRAHESGRRDADARLSVIAQRFAEAGLDPDRPYLCAGSTAAYPFVPPAPVVAAPGRAPPAPAIDGLVVATEIGARLVREAVWYADQCNWMGAPLADPRRGGVVSQALGPDLYAGTSGVALFLAELAAVTGDAAIRRTALGAIRQALVQAGTIPAPARLGLYTGWVGIALAATRAGHLLDAPVLIGQARDLLRILPADGAAEHDFLSGTAGAVAGLLVLAGALDDPALVERAARLGDALVAAADRSAAGYSWPARAIRPARNLTGLAHGAAGIGYALLELYAATGDAAYRAVAEQAYAYERHWFDAGAGNWPDFRTTAGRNRRARAFAVAWCHGAAGIALTRLRAHALLGDASYQAEAAVALSTTRRAAEAALAAGGPDFSLCHGLAGHAEVLRAGSPGAAVDDLVTAVAARGVAAARGAEGAWPCGTGGGETPGLLLGLAGIGLFYLRLHAPRVPMPLLPRPGRWWFD
jgi:class II lanthipeptide synthase